MEMTKNGNALDTEGDDVKPLHWFPFVPKNWLSSAAVRAMRPEQRGAFIDLLAIAWGDGETEPALTTTDDEDLAEMSGLGERWATLGRKVRAQFIERDGRLYNVQLSQVWVEQQALHAARSDKAAAAVAAREARRHPAGMISGSSDDDLPPISRSSQDDPGHIQLELESKLKEQQHISRTRETFPQFAGSYPQVVEFAAANEQLAGEWLETLAALPMVKVEKFVAETNKALQEGMHPAALVDAMVDWSTEIGPADSLRAPPRLMFWREFIRKAKANIGRDAARKTAYAPRSFGRDPSPALRIPTGSQPIVKISDAIAMQVLEQLRRDVANAGGIESFPMNSVPPKIRAAIAAAGGLEKLIDTSRANDSARTAFIAAYIPQPGAAHG